jgi:hypothetical protein
MHYAAAFLAIAMLVDSPALAYDDTPSAYVRYQPDFLPISFTLHSSGEVSVEAAQGIVTPIGYFSIGVEYPLRGSSEYIHVVIRNRARGVERVYRIRSGHPFSARYNGRGTLTASNHEIVIEATTGTVQVISGDPMNSSQDDRASNDVGPNTRIPYGSQFTEPYQNTSGNTIVVFLAGRRTVIPNGSGTVQITGRVEKYQGLKVLAVPAEGWFGLRTTLYFPFAKPA